jgi:hypothetical protein
MSLLGGGGYFISKPQQCGRENIPPENQHHKQAPHVLTCPSDQNNSSQEFFLKLRKILTATLAQKDLL